VRELTDFMMGPQPVGQARHPDRARAAATAAGPHVVDLRAEALRMEFFDVAAVIVFLRKVSGSFRASPSTGTGTGCWRCTDESRPTARSSPNHSGS
jgi:hypothetical protein